MNINLTDVKISVVERINAFLKKPQYIMTVMLLAVLSNILSAELAVYGLYTLAVVYICLLGDDLLPFIPVLVAAYVAPSARNNPGRAEQSVFAAGHGGGWIMLYGAVIVLALIVYVVRNRKQYFSRKYALIAGMAVLSGAYLLSGIGSPAYPAALGKNLLFAFLQSAAIVVPYFLIAGGVKWEQVRTDYFAWTGFCLGGLLLCQIGWIYYAGGVVVQGVIIRTQIFTGWGMYNNIGGLLAMMIPFAFYLATKYRRGWIGTVVGSAFLVGVLLTCSRSSILMAVVIYVICVLLMLHYAKNRKTNLIAFVAVLAALALIALLFHRQLLQLFSDLLAKGTDPSTRNIIYWEGLKQFWKYPVFGSSFFSPGYTPWEWSTNAAFSGFFPPRWHNTVVQLLVSCGIVGMAAYSFHRVQTLKLFFCGQTKEKTFIGCAILVLLVCSLLDCHFFNYGPVLLYSMGLAFAENCPE